MKTINELRETLKAEYVGRDYGYSTTYNIGSRAKTLLEENFEKAGLSVRQVFLDDDHQTVNLKVRGASGYDHAFIQIKIKKAKGEKHYHYCGSTYDWAISDIEVESCESVKDESGNYSYITDLDKIMNKVVEYLDDRADREKKKISQAADILEYLMNTYGLTHYYQAQDLATYISKNYYTIREELEARHPETNIL